MTARGSAWDGGGPFDPPTAPLPPVDYWGDPSPGYVAPARWQAPGAPQALRPRRRGLRLLRRLMTLIVVLVVLVALALGALLLVTPSVGNAPTLARQQDVAHHSVYPGPPVPARFAASLVATEDHRFYSEPGVDPLAIARVVEAAVTRQGGQGGATLDPQLAGATRAARVSPSNWPSSCTQTGNRECPSRWSRWDSPSSSTCPTATPRSCRCTRTSPTSATATTACPQRAAATSAPRQRACPGRRRRCSRASSRGRPPTTRSCTSPGRGPASSTSSAGSWPRGRSPRRRPIRRTASSCTWSGGPGQAAAPHPRAPVKESSGCQLEVATGGLASAASAELAGRTFMVTGGHTGVGRATGAGPGGRGGRVYVACRS